MTTFYDISDFRLLIPETIDLEDEDYKTATQGSNHQETEAQKWQAYINILGLCGVEHWLKDNCNQSYKIRRELDKIASYPYLNYHGFRFCLLVQEDFIEDEIIFPKSLIQKPEDTAHFYVALEILEEEGEAIIKGFIRYDQLSQLSLAEFSDSCLLLPIIYFNPEPNHLITACQFLTPEAIPLPQISSQENQISIETKITQLTQLLQDILVNEWKNLVYPQPQVVFRSEANDSKKVYKIIPLETNLTIVLIIEMNPREEGKLGIKISLRSQDQKDSLPNTLSLILKTGQEKIKETVQGDGQSNTISLKGIKLKPQQRFKVQITNQSNSYEEIFVLG